MWRTWHHWPSPFNSSNPSLGHPSRPSSQPAAQVRPPLHDRIARTVMVLYGALVCLVASQNCNFQCPQSRKLGMKFVPLPPPNHPITATNHGTVPRPWPFFPLYSLGTRYPFCKQDWPLFLPVYLEEVTVGDSSLDQYSHVCQSLGISATKLELVILVKNRLV